MTILSEIRRAFDKAAPHYEKTAVIQHEIGMRLFERLDYLRLEPKYVLDLGGGTGYWSKKLKARYPHAFIVNLDMSWQMLRQARTGGWFRKKNTCVLADMSVLPFQTGQFDLVFSNQAVHWALDAAALYKEIQRIMAVDGCFMASTLGPDTFLEMRKSFAEADGYHHQNDFMDMHDVGDVMLRAGFAEPVVDMEKITSEYPSVMAILKSLKAQGVRNTHHKRLSGLMGRQHWQRFLMAYETYRREDGRYPLTYEVVYLHGFKGKPKARDGVINIPLSSIGRQS